MKITLEPVSGEYSLFRAQYDQLIVDLRRQRLDVHLSVPGSNPKPRKRIFKPRGISSCASATSLTRLPQSRQSHTPFAAGFAPRARTSAQ